MSQTKNGNSIRGGRNWEKHFRRAMERHSAIDPELRNKSIDKFIKQNTLL